MLAADTWVVVTAVATVLILILTYLLVATERRRSRTGTKADLKAGDLIEPGRPSNFGKRERITTYVYRPPPWMQPLGGQSCRSAKVPAGSTWWNRPARSQMTPI